MVEVRAFPGVRFDTAKVELAKVVAPPFDVINEKERARLGKLDPHNVVHVTLPAPPKNSKPKDPAEHASKLFDAWREAGILHSDLEDAIYAYEIWHTIGGQERRMRGFLCALKVDPTYKQVIPHERIFEKPAEARLKVLRATGVDLEPIWLLYSGKTVEATLWAYLDGSGRTPDQLVTMADGSIHKVWRVNDPAVGGTVIDGLKGRKAYIADGHHRYATAVKYAEERRLREYRPSKTAPYEYKMVLLTNMADAGLTILPTHRVVLAPKRIDLASLWAKLGELFSLEEKPLPKSERGRAILDALEAAANVEGHAFCLYGGGSSFWVARTTAPVVPEDQAPGRSFSWRSLDVSFLQKMILERGVGIPEAQWGDDVYYTRDEEEAVSLVAGKKAGLAVFHRPTRLAQLRAIVDGGEVMPPKSTYFTPKPASGLVFYAIGKPEPGEPPKRRLTS